MNGKIAGTIAWRIVISGCRGWHDVASASPRRQSAVSKHGPLDQYLIGDRNAEIAMARTAAPESISQDAEVLVLDSMVTKP